MVQHEEAPILRFYRRVRNSNKISDIDLPSSSIWYVRAAIEARYGVTYTVEHVQISAWLEGMIPVGCVTRIPSWYVQKYMGGVEPNFSELKRQVRIKYDARQQALALAEEVLPECSLANILVD